MSDEYVDIPTQLTLLIFQNFATALRLGGFWQLVIACFGQALKQVPYFIGLPLERWYMAIEMINLRHKFNLPSTFVYKPCIQAATAVKNICFLSPAKSLQWPQSQSQIISANCFELYAFLFGPSQQRGLHQTWPHKLCKLAKNATQLSNLAKILLKWSSLQNNGIWD